MDWWTQNKDAITAIGAALAATITLGGIIWAIFKWGILRWWHNRIRVDVKVFELITDPSVLLPKLYATENDDSPLADHNIKYQPRDPNQDLQAELKAALHRSRYLLITAPTGYGKTREAGMLAQTMMLEGWRVLRVKLDEWLDVPKILPKELGGNRSRVLILLDDLNGLFSAGNSAQSPRVESDMSLMLGQLSYHDRLLQVLDMFEATCTESEIRVIATARSEAEQWKLLDYDENDRLWKRFVRVEVREPSVKTIINLLEDTTKQANIPADENEFEAIVHKSDGTYRNILLNLRRYSSQNKPVSKDDFTDTLDGSWHDIYERAIQKYSAVKYIYEAIDILRQASIDLIPPYLVEAVALTIWGGKGFRKLIRYAEIIIALNYLTRETNILRKTKDDDYVVSDGQIEAKGTKTDLLKFTQNIEEFILTTKYMFTSKGRALIIGYVLLKIGIKHFEDGSKDEALRVWQKTPSDNSNFLFNEYAAYSLALYAKDKEIAQKLIDDKEKANTDTFFVQIILGVVAEKSGYPTYAEAFYRKAINLNPSNVDPYKRLANLFRFKVSGRVGEALALLEKIIEINRKDFPSYLAISAINKQLGNQVSINYINTIRHNIPEDDFYNRACLESVCDNFDLAFQHLRKAALREKFNPTWAWEDPDLQWIRDDPRFVEIVGPKPENKNSEN